MYIAFIWVNQSFSFPTSRQRWLTVQLPRPITPLHIYVGVQAIDQSITLFMNALLE